MKSEVAKLIASGSYREVLYLHAQRVSAFLRPREFRFPPLLKAHILHAHLFKTRFSADVNSATALTDAYMKLRFMGDALKVFEEMPERNLGSLNAVVTGFLKNGYCREALNAHRERCELQCFCFRASTGENPNSVTLISAVSACASLSYLRFGKQVHGLIVKIKIGLDVMIGTALVDMYSKRGPYAFFKELDEKRNLFTWNAMIAGMILNAQAENAVELFEQLEFEGFEPDSVTWNSMISGFSQLGKGIEAFKCFKRMQSAGEVPSLKSITSLLPARADLSALHCGKEVHGHAILAMICSFQLLLSTSFWNAIISGYGRNGENADGRNGECESAFGVFEQMLEEKVQRNAATFTSLLSMCSHTGLVDKGLQVFRMINKDFGLKPNPFGLNEARELIEQLPEPSGAVFDSLLGACEGHLDSELEKEVATKLSELEPENPAPFVILSKIYAALGRWEDAEKIRGLMNDKTRRKLPGFSLLRLHEK
ncbi:pentatricopeptide repeat-containing protein [Pyrus ussuriensis x Pyrus communis]|uniref:Pentatricopeptide repeat-containing protein n=1 Tax=Pyrus ussuriensis x Pyrus communis TaxID=2448454 RepID=A0A5N5HMV3_9ROSA|nr:pentatricopeptide repeat-containing protein [Pyrus ussuriensis x Pyrus communis]